MFMIGLVSHPYTNSRLESTLQGWGGIDMNRIIMFLAGFYISFESCFCMKSMAVSLRTHRLRLTVVCLWRGAALDFGAGKLHRPEWMSVDIVKICENGLTRNSWVGVSGLGDYVSVLIQIFISNVYCISWFLWFYSTPCPCTTFAVLCGFEKLGTRQQQKWAKPLASSQQNAVVFLWIWWFCCIKNYWYSWLMHIQCELSLFFTLLYASLRAATRLTCVFKLLHILWGFIECCGQVSLCASSQLFLSHHSFTITYHGSLAWNGNMYSIPFKHESWNE